LHHDAQRSKTDSLIQLSILMPAFPDIWQALNLLVFQAPVPNTNSSNSSYALSLSSLTMMMSCTPSIFEYAISFLACSNLFCMLPSSSVPLPLSLASSTSKDGGAMKTYRALRSVSLICLTPCNIVNSALQAAESSLYYQLTSISISKTTTRPFFPISSIIFLLVPYLLPPNLACSTKPFSAMRPSNSCIGT